MGTMNKEKLLIKIATSNSEGTIYNLPLDQVPIAMSLGKPRYLAKSVESCKMKCLFLHML